jgi:hypothetical protein
LTSPSDELAEFFKLRPRDRIYLQVMDDLFSLENRAREACLEPTCGARDEDGEIISCSSVNCGEKIMLSGYRRRLQVMRDVKALVEGLERAQLEQQAAADKRGKR